MAKKLSIRGKDIRSIGYPEGPVISVAINTMEKHYKHYSLGDALRLLKEVLESPAAFTADDILGNIAKMLIPKAGTTAESIGEVSLNKDGIHFNVFGREFIEEGAMHQMYQAAKLPISVAGALMPDAHHGYGLPIGGVLATENAIIPYGVGVDIGCRMCLSIFDIDPKDLIQRESYFTRELNEATLFGGGKEFKSTTDHEVLDNELFYRLPLLRGLHGRAAKQLGSSGSGNHFVEFGTVEVQGKDAVLGVEPGKYLGLLSHSGSRALGANIAHHYTKLAKAKRKLPGEAGNLAWFLLSEEEGWEYWLSMNLAGDYASACHHVIHHKIAKQLGRKPLKMVENHHNFAWKEMHDGKEVIVHRKGATPAGENVLGIIPGSMTAPGFIVKGKGETTSINSASHGAGRQMSRTQAMRRTTHNALKNELEKHNVTLLGGGLDEAPFAYKNIHDVMNAQQQLVETVGLFYPKIVKMDGGTPKQWRNKKGEELTGE
jgi:tRNA-splicing ligase RtcB (3'-phosphate/5'-hydroxy nucleic acid ligase)